jgi:hypothetical protein
MFFPEVACKIRTAKSFFIKAFPITAFLASVVWTGILNYQRRPE